MRVALKFSPLARITYRRIATVGARESGGGVCGRFRQRRSPCDRFNVLHLELVTLLVDRDIDVNAVDRRGRTAMHGAARLARNTLIAVLVENGAKVDSADGRGQTPLDVGTVSRPLHPDTANLLRSLGATSGALDSGQR